MRILQLYHKMPFPVQDGGAFSIYSTSRSMLSEGILLKVLAMETARDPGNTHFIPHDFTEMTGFETVRVDNTIRPVDAAISLVRRDSYFSRRFISENFKQKLAEILEATKFDIVQLEHVYLCHYLDVIRKNSNAKIVLRAQNVENRVWSGYCARSKDMILKKYLQIESRKLGAFERCMTAKVDGVIALTDIDARYFKLTCGSKNVAVIPVGIDVSLPEGHDMELQYRRPLYFYHLGSMDWRPNIQGVRWFVKEVLPKIIHEVPGIRIHLAGKLMPPWLYRCGNPNLVIDGTVPDAVKYIEDKAVMIVPLLAGSGIRVKILEGMAAGKVVISTSVGAQGIRAVHDESILIADTPRDFAMQMQRCARSAELCRRIGGNARKIALEHYDLRRIGAQLKEFYERLV